MFRLKDTNIACNQIKLKNGKKMQKEENAKRNERKRNKDKASSVVSDHLSLVVNVLLELEHVYRSRAKMLCQDKREKEEKNRSEFEAKMKSVTITMKKSRNNVKVIQR